MPKKREKTKLDEYDSSFDLDLLSSDSSEEDTGCKKLKNRLKSVVQSNALV